MVSSLTCLSQDDWNSWGLPGLLQGVSLGFLTAWPSWGAQNMYMVASFPQSEHSKRPREISKAAHASEVTWHHIHYNLLINANYGASSDSWEGATQGDEC